MNDETTRFDVLLVDVNRRNRLMEGQAVSLLRHLFATGVIQGGDEAIAAEWVEIYTGPGPAGHVPFVPHGRASDRDPAFLEAVLRFGSKPCPIPWGGEGEVLWFLEFRGCAFPEPLGQFRKRLVDFQRIHIDVFTRTHEGLPPHREVGPDERPAEAPASNEPIGGAVGTRVVEL